MALDSGKQSTVESSNKRTYVNFYNPDHDETNVEPGDAEAGYFEAMEWAKDATNRKELVGELVHGVMLARRGEFDEERQDMVKDPTDLLTSVSVLLAGSQDLHDLQEFLNTLLDEEDEVEASDDD